MLMNNIVVIFFFLYEQRYNSVFLCQEFAVKFFSLFDSLLEQLSADRIGIALVLLTLLCDWFRKLAPLSRPIRNETYTNHDLGRVCLPALDAVCLFLL